MPRARRTLVSLVCLKMGTHSHILQFPEGGSNPSAGRPMSRRRMWSVCTVGCHSASRRKETLTHATARVNVLEAITLSEVSLVQTDPVRPRSPEVPGTVTTNATDGRMAAAGTEAGIGETGSSGGTQFRFSRVCPWMVTVVAPQRECT